MIRVSGKDAYKSLNFIQDKQPIMSGEFDSLKTLPKPYFKKLQPYHVYHKKFYSLLDLEKTGKRSILDEGLILLFSGPKSFTGESIFIKKINIYA